jgi:hypothetical protein
MSKPGVVVRRPVGSDGPFREHADLPTDLAGEGSSVTAEISIEVEGKHGPVKISQPLSPHIPDGGEHGYGDEEKDREDNHHMVGHRAPAS